MAVLVIGASVPGNAAGARVRRTTTASRTSRSARASTRARVLRRPTSATAAKLSVVRAKRAKAALRVRAATAEQRRVQVALRDINSNVQSQSAAVGNARIAASTAARDAIDARDDERRAELELASLGAARRRAVLQAYVHPPSSDFAGLLSSAGINEAGERVALRSIVGRKDADVIDRVRALEEDLTDARARAVRLAERAAGKRQAYEARLRRLKGARASQIEYSGAVEDRLERNLSEAESLRAFDTSLSKKLDAENALWARQLAAARVGGVGGRTGGRGAIAIPRDIATGSTHGIVVASSIRGKLAALLDAAAKDGVYLTGGGYRSPQQQVVLRRAHCGSSSFAVYQMRASQCRPPTARPGASMHERGLAIDFRDQYSSGSLTRSSPGYRWLRGNAARFGFKNLPSEPWHWSINGR